MKSNSTYFLEKSSLISKIKSLRFFKKTKVFGIGFLSVVLLFISMGFAESNTDNNNIFSSSFHPLNNENYDLMVGDNDTLDLALIMTTTSTSACPGSEIFFVLEVFNQGDSTAANFELTDYIPAGLSLSTTTPNGWVVNSGKAKKTVTTPLVSFGIHNDTIYFDVDSSWTGTSLENRAEISAADGDNDPNNNPPVELDSVLDDIDNDSIGGDNLIDGSLGDADHHDFALVNNDAPVLTNVMVTPALCNFDNGTATLTPSGFIAYNWSDGGTGSTRTDLIGGMYQVTFTKSSGCTGVENIEILNDCTGCEATAGTVTIQADSFCLTGDSILVNFTDDLNSVLPQPQFIQAFILTKDSSKTIMAVDTFPFFPIYEKGTYRVHVKVFDALHVPQEELDSLVLGDSELSFFHSFLQDGGGYLCGDLDTIGVAFEVGTAKSSVVFSTGEDCGMGNGSVTMSPSNYSYTWSDGGSGATRSDLSKGTYSVTVDGCAGCQDSVTNIVVGSNCILNDTISFTIELDSTETICGNALPGYFSSNTTTTLCAGGTSGGDGTYGTYTVSETGCINYSANLLSGNSIDTICVVVNDDMGNADTTIFIPTIICHIVPQIVNIPCDSLTGLGHVCLPIEFDSLSNYNITLNGNPIQSGLVGCDSDSVMVFDYSALFAQGLFGPYHLDSFIIDGQNFEGTFQTMPDLIDSLNMFDPAGNWILDAVNFTLTGGNAMSTYGDLQIFHPLTNLTESFVPIVNYIFAGSEIPLIEGTFQIIYSKIGDNCPIEVLEATVSCGPCLAYLPADTVELVTQNCSSPGNYCIDIPTADMFNYIVTVDGLAYGGSLMACDFSGSNDGTNLELALGLHEVIFTRIATSCSDTVLVNVTCPPCPDLIPTTMALETIDCHLNVNTCLNILTADLSDYEILDNGALYAGSISECSDSLNAAIAVDTGFHEIILNNLITGCSDTMNLTVSCIPDTIVIDTVFSITGSDTLCLDELLVGDIADLEINCGDTSDIIINYTIDSITNCIIFEGVMIGGDTLCFSLRDINGNRTDVFITIAVISACDDFIAVNNLNLSISDCAGTRDLCFDIPLAEIGAYSITDNGVGYAGTVTGCDFDTSYSFTYFSVPDQGSVGPYSMDAWTVNDSTYSGTFMTIEDLVDSMNVWDMTSVWTLNTTNFTIVGGNPNSTYGNITITQTATTAFALLEPMENIVPNGTAIQVGTGAHEVIVTVDSTLCTDTIQAMVFCLIPEIVMDTINIGDTMTYCVDTTELLGNVISFSNTCPTQSGDLVEFTLVDSSYCVNYTGLFFGDNSACIIVCDDNGLCDTTTIFVHVLADTSDLPVAVTDFATTNIDDDIVIDILGNDTITDTFLSYDLLDAPTNGSVIFNGDGTITYLPNLGFCDDETPDSLTYILCNTSGCDTATVYISVPCTVQGGPLTFHNGFSPNGDGVNDFFTIHGVDAFPDNVLCIFNRWGNRVFYGEGYNNTFDGIWQNIRVPDGTYFYVFDDGLGNRYSGYVQIAR